MRPTDEPRICQFRDSTTSAICGVPIRGRGRWKWCPICAELVREARQKAGSSRWLKNWRTKHPIEYENRQRIYREEEKVRNDLLERFPQLPERLLHCKIVEDFRHALDQHRTDSKLGQNEGLAGPIAPIVTESRWILIPMPATWEMLKKRNPMLSSFEIGDLTLHDNSLEYLLEQLVPHRDMDQRLTPSLLGKMAKLVRTIKRVYEPPRGQLAERNRRLSEISPRLLCEIFCGLRPEVLMKRSSINKR